LAGRTLTDYRSELIDPIEMYLRVILECEEECVPPMNARITERLGRSAPTVHTNLNRMKHQRLILINEDRHLRLSRTGRQRAISVMRKHRLAEALLVHGLGVPYEQAHNEANRFQHVMGDRVETFIYQSLGRPTHSPYGNPIPGLAEIGGISVTGESAGGEYNLFAGGFTGDAVVSRIAEWTQSDTALMKRLYAAGVVPGRTVTVSQHPGHVTISGPSREVRLAEPQVRGIFVTKQGFPPRS